MTSNSSVTVEITKKSFSQIFFHRKDAAILTPETFSVEGGNKSKI